MKKNKGRVLALVVLMTAAFVYAAPGSEDDPIITLSYFENKLEAFTKQMEDKIDSALADIDRRIEDKLKDVDVSSGKPEPVKVQDSSQVYIFEAHKIDAGTDIILGDSTEFIVRRGSASVIDPKGNNIADLTAGKDIKANTIVPQNHHLLNPVADGRGLRVLGDDDFWIMIKGPFELK